LFQELYDALDRLQVDWTDIRDLGDRVVATGHLSTGGKGSGVDTESPFGTVIEIANGKAIRIRSYLDADEALAAADLPE
jgi:ketosteroid isomerase-like protein